jgi:hypothetical protein
LILDAIASLRIDIFDKDTFGKNEFKYGTQRERERERARACALALRLIGSACRLDVRVLLFLDTQIDDSLFSGRADLEITEQECLANDGKPFLKWIDLAHKRKRTTTNISGRVCVRVLYESEKTQAARRELLSRGESMIEELSREIDGDIASLEHPLSLILTREPQRVCLQHTNKLSFFLFLFLLLRLLIVSNIRTELHCISCLFVVQSTVHGLHQWHCAKGQSTWLEAVSWNVPCMYQVDHCCCYHARMHTHTHTHTH